VGGRRRDEKESVMQGMFDDMKFIAIVVIIAVGGVAFFVGAWVF
jgi:hypothetical protein